MDASRIFASLSTRELGLSLWQKQIERTAERRKAKEDRTFDRVIIDRFNPEVKPKVEVTNPISLPPSEPKLNPANETIGPGNLMPPFHRNVIMARAALAQDIQSAIFFNR